MLNGRAPAIKPQNRELTEALLMIVRREARFEAEEQLFQRVYDELRSIAAAMPRWERPGHTLQPTALVHEAYLRLVDHERVPWRGRTYFFGAAGRAMRQVLVDHARRKKSCASSAGSRSASSPESWESPPGRSTWMGHGEEVDPA